MRALGGRYRLDAQAGRGGMGQVWRATDLDLERTVAVKLLPAELAGDPDFRGRFRREAKLLGGLSHEGIAVLHDVGEDGGEPFLVMEFVDGRTLGEATGGRPVETGWALGVVRQLAAALAYSHRQGLIHRDIKPANVMLTESGTVKILDFGISKALSSRTTNLTGTGMSLGTPSYMSPEQIDGREVDIRSDQYSLGCLLYELLTGRTPFVGDSPFAVMNQHLTKAPAPPSTLNPQVPQFVDALTLRLLAKDPTERFATMEELIAALSGAQTVPPQPVAPPTPTPAPVPTALATAVGSQPAAPQPGFGPAPGFVPGIAPAQHPYPHPHAGPGFAAGPPFRAQPAPPNPAEIRARNLARVAGLLAEAGFTLFGVLMFEFRVGPEQAALFWEIVLVLMMLTLVIGTPVAWAALSRRTRNAQRGADPAAGGQAATTWLLALAGATLGVVVNFVDWFQDHLGWALTHVSHTPALPILALGWLCGLGWFALAYLLARLTHLARSAPEGGAA